MIGIVIVLLLTMGVVFDAENKANKQRELAEQKQAKQWEFQREIDRAKQETGDPCNPVFFWVSSLENSAPTLIVMGKALSLDGHNDPGRYWLLPKLDRVELWYASGAPGNADMGKPNHQQKIGEKFAGGVTNPLCKGK